MATERLSNQFIETAARKIRPPGKAFAEFERGNRKRVAFGKIHRGFYVERGRVVGPRVERERASSPTIGILRLEDRRYIISKCKKPLNVVAEATGVLAGAVVLDGTVRNRSARRVAIGLLGGAAVWMGTRVVVEICEQTINSLNDRIALLGQLAKSVPQEQPPQS